MVSTSIKIDRSINHVWEYFTTPSNWSKWYGGALKEVSPRWETGARLIWGLGGSSQIQNLIPNGEVVIDGGFVLLSFQFEKIDSQSTMITISKNPTRGANFTDGGAAELVKMKEELRKMKLCIESETPINQELPAAEAPKVEPQPVSEERLGIIKVMRFGFPAVYENLFVTSDRMVVARTSDGWNDYLAWQGATAPEQRSDNLRNFSTEDVLKSNKQNYQIVNSEIVGIEVKKKFNVISIKLAAKSKEHKWTAMGLVTKVSDGKTIGRIEDYVSFLRPIYGDKFKAP